MRRYATRWKIERRKDAGDGVTAFIPLMFRPGEAYQFDWSHEDVEIAGAPMRVKVAHMRLCASREVYVRASAAAGAAPEGRMDRRPLVEHFRQIAPTCRIARHLQDHIDK